MAQLDISKRRQVAIHGTKVDMVAERPLALGSLVLLRRLVVLHPGRRASGRTTMGAAVQLPPHGLSDKTAAGTVAMVVRLVLLVHLGVVLLLGSLRRLPRLLAAAMATAATLVTISKAMAVRLLPLPRDSATSCSNTASKRHPLRHPTFPHRLRARLHLHLQEMCLLLHPHLSWLLFRYRGSHFPQRWESI